MFILNSSWDEMKNSLVLKYLRLFDEKNDEEIANILNQFCLENDWVSNNLDSYLKDWINKKI